jgi:type II secretory pathway component PulC
LTYFRMTANAVFLLYWTTAALGADAPAPAPDSSGVSLSNPLAAQSLERLSATVDRPLFSPSRRPPPRPVARAPEPPAPPTPPPDLVLTGIVMDGQSARAVVRLGAEKKILHAQIGDDIGGWKVSQIEGRKLVLSLDGRFATFMLFNREVDQRILGDGTVSDRSVRAPQPLQRQQQNSSPASQNSIDQRKRDWQRMGD